MNFIFITIFVALHVTGSITNSPELQPSYWWLVIAATLDWLILTSNNIVELDKKTRADLKEQEDRELLAKEIAKAQKGEGE